MKAGEDAVQESTAQDAPRWPALGVETYVIQCNLCFKWRVVPSKERYEAIREHVLEKPFVCVNAQEWRPNTTCDDPADLDDDEPTVLWAIDRHNIPRTPEGFHRKVHLRSVGTHNKFSDVYYTTPCGKTLRSGVQVQKYLDEHPELKVQISQFSFTGPRGRNDITQLRTGASPKRLLKNGTPPSKKSKGNHAVKPTGQGHPQASNIKAPRPKLSTHSASKVRDADHDIPSEAGEFHGSKGASNVTAVKRRRAMLT